MRSPDQIGITWEENQSLMMQLKEKQALENRRKNNIFEVGDFFVFLNGDNPEIMEVQHVWDGAVWGGYCGEIPKNKDIRHATDAEIEAGKRLEVV